MQIYLFGSITADLLIYFIDKMIQSFKEDDIDILVFVLHNIGLQLRKEETAKLKNLFDIAEQKRNQFSVFIKLEEADPNTKEDVAKLK